jgi:hypothetical protein
MTKEFEKLIDCNHYHPGGFVGFCTTFNRSSLICDYNTIQQRMKCMYNHNKPKHSITAPPKGGTTKMTPHIPNPTTSRVKPFPVTPTQENQNSPQTTTPPINSHLAKIHAKKILVRGEPYFEITGFDNILDHNGLPREYTSSTPRFLKVMNNVIVTPDYNSDHCFIFSLGNHYNEKDFNNLISTMKLAGARLTKINAQIKERAKKFDGSEITITI